MKALLLLILPLTACTPLRQDLRQDCASVSHRTTVTANPFPAVTSEWSFTMRPVATPLLKK